MATMAVRRVFRFRTLVQAPGPAAMRTIGLELAVKIENRTLRGRDENNRGFAPYSPAYAKRTRKRIVDLRGWPTPEMLPDLQPVLTTANRVGLGFATDFSAQKAQWHERGAGHLPVRRFLGLSETMVRSIVREVTRSLRVAGQTASVVTARAA